MSGEIDPFKGKCPCGRPRRQGGRNCLQCHAKFMRGWRGKNPLTPEQRKKDNCRSYANVYLGRGKIRREACRECGFMFAEMHHADYDKPLEVEWLCRQCHLDHHRQERLECQT